MQRLLRVTLNVALLGILVFLAFAAVVKSFGDARSRVLLSFIGVAAGAWLAEMNARALGAAPRTACAGLTAIVLSQAFFHALVWTGWVTVSATWRGWYLSLVAALTLTHLAALRSASQGRGDFFERATTLCAAAAGLAFFALGLRPRLVEPPSELYLYGAAAPAAGAILGSMLIWRRWARRHAATPGPVSARARLSASIGTGVALFLAGFYVGRVTLEPPSILDIMPSPLASMAPEEIESAVKADLARLKVVAENVDALRRRGAELERDLRARIANEGRDYYTPDEEDQIRAIFMTYVSCRAALLRMVAMYAGFESVRDPDSKARCFLVGYAAATTVFEASLAMIASYGEDPIARRKLNEASPEAGLPAGTFDRVVESASNPRHLELFEEMAAHFEHRRDGWRAAGVWPADDFAWLQRRIQGAIAGVRAKAVDKGRLAAMMERLVKRVKSDAYTPVYAVQSLVSTLIGDTRLVTRPPFITRAQIKAMQARLRPGDILIERRNWFLSNAFLPGFWPHAALYAGTPEDLRRIGVADDPVVREKWGDFAARAHDGEPHTVIESVSEGVIFNSLTESMLADYVAVLRPRVSDAQVARAIVNAFRHQGKPYDFEFDFFTADKLVCTELVYRSYEGAVRFPLVKIMGRNTLPALEMVRMFARERGSQGRQLDFVLFLDGDAATMTAREADEEAFVLSADRPGAFNE